MTRKLLPAALGAVSIVATVLAAHLPAADAAVAHPAPSVGRVVVVSQTGDRGHDLAYNKTIAPEVAARADLYGIRVTFGLSAQTKTLQFSMPTRQATPDKAHPEVYTAHLSWGGPARNTSHTRVRYQVATHKLMVLRGNRFVTCPDAGVAGGQKTVTVSAPVSCLGVSGPFRYRGESSIAGAHGGWGHDETAWTYASLPDLAGVRSWEFVEKAGDVTYVGDKSDPATWVADSVDLEPGAKVTSDGTTVTVAVPVADLSYYPWDPRQQFTLSMRGAQGALGTLVAVPDRTSTGRMSVTGTDKLASCAAAATSDANTVTFSVPSSCSPDAVTQFALAAQATSDDAKTIYGGDTLPWTGRVLVG